MSISTNTIFISTLFGDPLFYIQDLNLKKPVFAVVPSQISD